MKNYGDLGGCYPPRPKFPLPLLTPASQAISRWAQLVSLFAKAGIEITTDTVANATNIFSLATKNSGLVAKVATRFLYILDLN